MPKFRLTEYIQQTNIIEVFASSKEDVEVNYWAGSYNEVLDKPENIDCLEVDQIDVEEVKEQPPIDYTQFLVKD